MSVRVLQGDCREVLKTLPDSSVHCIVTSPPYYGLRAYLPEGHADKRLEIGAEKTPDEYVAEMVTVFREVRRVLRDDGVLWLNIGSSFCNKRVESSRYVVRRDLPDAYRSKVAKVMSSVWSGYASPEQAVQAMSLQGDCSARELPGPDLSEVCGSVPNPSCSSEGRDRNLLFSELRTIGSADEKTRSGNLTVPTMLKDTGAISCGHAQEQDKDGVLRQPLLVQLQSEGQSLSVERRSAREDESFRNGVEEVSFRAGQVSLPELLHDNETGGASHPTISEPQGGDVGRVEWDYAVPAMPQITGQERDEVRRGANILGDDTSGNLASLTFHVSAIPDGFKKWCEPESVIKAKDDYSIPAQVAIALRADGWYLRSDCIWHKPNPLPESVTDRPTSAHEHVFLLTENARYYYDADAIKEVSIDTSGTMRMSSRRAEGAGVSPSGNEVDPTKGVRPSFRNSHNVWTIATQPFSGAHFATMPPALVERCIKAGSSERGCCPHCKSPWTRIITKGEPDEAHRAASGADKSGGYNGQSTKGHDAHGVQNASDVKRRILEGMRERVSTWEPTCKCPSAAPIPCTILDPFGGAGTTGLVADRLQRNAILIELNPAYADMARDRLSRDAGLWGDVA